MKLRAPFPWFGGKRRVAPLVWERFGEVRNYIEPFAGSLAVLLARPHAPGVETVNDTDAYLCNFWRAVIADPDQVAHFADWPVNENDLHARHRWLVESGRARVEQLTSDPDFYDAKVAGWWVWGLSAWIGSGWCSPKSQGWNRMSMTSDRGVHAGGVTTWQQRPELSSGTGRGVHAGAVAEFDEPSIPQKLPNLAAGSGRGSGVHCGETADFDRRRGVHAKRPALATGNGGGTGVHRVSLTRQLPDLGGDYGASGRGVHSAGLVDRTGGIYAYLRALQVRLRRVRVTCGDFVRVLGPAVTTCIGVTGVLLDPPYDEGERTRGLYAGESPRLGEALAVSERAREWALVNGNDPKLRIALCGYEGEHDMPDDWTCVAWKASGGYGRSARGKANAERERIWFSPHCLRVSEHGPLFSEVAHA